MMGETLAEVVENGLGDHRVASVQWSADGRDIAIEFERGDRMLMRIRFVWATDLSLKWDFGGYQGRPLVYESTFSRLPKDRWSVVLDFSPAPEGALAFECNSIQIEPLIR